MTSPSEVRYRDAQTLEILKRNRRDGETLSDTGRRLIILADHMVYERQRETEKYTTHRSNP